MSEIGADYWRLWQQLRRSLRARRVHLVVSQMNAMTAGRDQVASCRQSDIETIDRTLWDMEFMARSAAQRARKRASR